MWFARVVSDPYRGADSIVVDVVYSRGSRWAAFFRVHRR
jgi:hypothetical protein